MTGLREIVSKDGRMVAQVAMPRASVIATAMAIGVRGPDPIVIRTANVPKNERNTRNGDC